MSNHLHVVVRNRPDIVQSWSDGDVARRWWNLFPKRRDDEGQPKPPTDFELLMITADPVRLADIRRRLSDVSWFPGAPGLPGRADRTECEQRGSGSWRILGRS